MMMQVSLEAALQILGGQSDIWGGGRFFKIGVLTTQTRDSHHEVLAVTME